MMILLKKELVSNSAW